MTLWRRLLAVWLASALLGVSWAAQGETTSSAAILAEVQGLIAQATDEESVEAHPTTVLRQGEVEGIECAVTYDWPKELRVGYFPVGVQLTNTTDSKVLVDVEAAPGWAGEDRVTRSVQIEPGGVVEFEMLLRARRNGYNSYQLTVETGGEETQMGPCGPENSWRRGDTRTVMLVSKQTQPAGSEEAWTEEWTACIDRGPKRRMMPVSVSARIFSQLSTSWQAYTSLDSVVLDLSGGLPAPDQFAALIAWCRAGGKLILLGSPVHQLRKLPVLADQLEDRFEHYPSDSEFAENGLVAYHLGFGTLIASERVGQGGSPFTSGPSARRFNPPDAFIADQARCGVAWSRGSFGRPSRQNGAQSLLDHFSDLPLRSLILLILVFAVLMGPVNFMWVKRMKKPIMLLVSVPAIALVTSVLLLLYGVLFQGLDVKSITRSWSLLDQRSQVATISEVRNVFAGSAPGEGLRPQLGTAVFPERRYWEGSFNNRHRFIADQTRGLLLSGDFLPVRQPFSQMILSDRPSRLRLEVTWDSGKVNVSNALGADLERLLLRAPNGEYYHLKEPLEQGSSADLIPGGDSADRSRWARDLRTTWGTKESSSLLTGTYVAQLSDPVFQDDCGVEVTEIEGRHVLVGILDQDVGAWR